MLIGNLIYTRSRRSARSAILGSGLPDALRTHPDVRRLFPDFHARELDYYRRTPEAINNLRAPIFEEKVIDFIVELAKLEERKVTPQELMTGAAEEEDGTTPE